MGIKIEELGARFEPLPYHGAKRLTFRCPTCRQRLVTCDVWSGPKTTLEYEPGKTIKLWHAEQGPNCDWDTLSITPSIDSQHGKPSAGCTGWHGHVTNGEAA